MAQADARGDEWEEKARKAKNKMADNASNIKVPSINSMRWDARDRAKWRTATAVVARGRTRLDGTRCKVTRLILSEGNVQQITTQLFQMVSKSQD